MEITSPLPPKEIMQKATFDRDTSYDGIFFVAVKSTGIFCRPSCTARKPMVQNIVYYPTARDAMFSGYRPCKRCRPLAVNGEPPDWVGRLMDIVESDPQRRITNADLSGMGIDPARARRYFLKQYGVTFQAYARSRRLGEALTQIREGAPLDDVALGTGFDSHSGFREAFSRTFGTPPGQSRDSQYIRTAMLETPIGPMLAGAMDEGICLLEFSERRRLEAQFTVLRRRFTCPVMPGSHPYLEQLQTELDEYFAGTRTAFSLPMVYPGSEFQHTVWKALLRIPYGTTTSYEKIAIDIGVPKAARAVGTANGWNRISILIPCHRVVNKDGQLGGYGGGLWRKQILLDLEKNNLKQIQGN